MFGDDDIRQLKRHGGRRCSPFRRRQLRRGGSNVGEWQIKRERASLAGRTAKLNFAAQQACEFTADRQPQAGPAVLAARARICLLKGLEDDALFIQSNSNTRIGYLEGDHRSGAVENRMIFGPSFRSDRQSQAYGAVLGEFESVRKQVDRKRVVEG